MRKFSACFELVGLQFEARQLGDAVDQTGDLGTEALLDVAERRDGVLDRVVQQPGRHRGGVELHLGEQPGHLDRVGEIRITQLAHLCAVRLHRIDVGAVKHRLVRLRIVGFDQIDEVRLPHHPAAFLEGRFADR